MLLTTHPAQAGQTEPPPAPAPTPSEPPTYPVVTLGTITYVQYAADLRDEHLNAFDVPRGYLQFNADLSPRVGFRLTPDIRRATTGSLDGSLVLRLKFAYVDFHTPDRTAWLRLGLHQTPWLDFEEGVNRYRVQGQMFAEREGAIPGSSDFGVGYLGRLAGGRAEIQAGLYNGEGFARTDVDAGKSVQARLTVRPWGGGLRGLRFSAFGDRGSSSTAPDRRHAIVMGSFESRHVVATLQALRSTRPVDGLRVRTYGYSAFLELRRATTGPAVLTRVDDIQSRDRSSAQRRRVIAGGAYWWRWDRIRLGAVVTVERSRSTFEPTVVRERRLLAQTQVQF